MVNVFFRIWNGSVIIINCGEILFGNFPGSRFVEGFPYLVKFSL